MRFDNPCMAGFRICEITNPSLKLPNSFLGEKPEYQINEI